MKDYNDRTSLTGVRMVFTLLAMIIGAGTTEIVIALFSPKGNPKSPEGHIGMTLVFGGIMLIAGLIAYFSTKKYDLVLEKKKDLHIKTYFYTFKNKPFMVLLASYFFLTIATVGVSSIFVYYVNYCLGMLGFASSIIMGVLVISSIAALPLWAMVSSICGTTVFFKSKIIRFIGYLLSFPLAFSISMLELNILLGIWYFFGLPSIVLM